MKTQSKQSNWCLWALLAVIVLLVGVALAPLLSGGKTIKPSGDYSGMTEREALFAECEARGVALSPEEEAQLLTICQDAQRQYALLGQQYTLEELMEEEREYQLFDKLMEALPLDVSVSDKEIEEWYTVRLGALKRSFEKDPGIFKSQQDLYDKHGGVEPLVVPEGYVYVRHILVETEEEALAIREKLDSGEDFQTLMKTHGIDSGMLEEPYATLGYLVGPYASAMDYYDEFKRAALALEQVGDYSDVVRTPSGYEILQLVSRLEAGEKPLAQVRGQIDTLLLNSKKSTALTELLKEWTA